MCSFVKTFVLLIFCTFLIRHGDAENNVEHLNKIIDHLKVKRKFSMFWSDLNGRCSLNMDRILELYGKEGVHNGSDRMAKMLRIRFKSVIARHFNAGYVLDLDRALSLYANNDIHNGTDSLSMLLAAHLRWIILENFTRIYDEAPGKFRNAIVKRLEYLRYANGSVLILETFVERLTKLICPASTEGLYPNVRYYHNTLPLSMRFYFFRSLSECIRRHDHSWTIVAAHYKILHDTNLVVSPQQASQMYSIAAAMPQDLQLVYISQQAVTLYNVNKRATLELTDGSKFLFNNCVEEVYRVCLATLNDQNTYTQLFDHLIVDWIESVLLIRRAGEYMCARQGITWQSIHDVSCYWRVYPVIA